MKSFFKKVRNKRIAALCLALLLILSTVLINTNAGGQSSATSTNNINFWDDITGPFDGNYYGKINRNFLYKLKIDNKASVCLNSTKKLNRGKTGTKNTYSFDAWDEAGAGMSREGALYLAYAMITGGGGNGREMDDAPYILVQTLCWMIEYKNGNPTMEDLNEYLTQTKDLAKHLKIDISGVLNKFAMDATRQLNVESVPSFASRYSTEAPKITLEKQDDGTYSKTFELINYNDALANGFDQVWMQYELAWNDGIKKAGLSDVLKYEQIVNGAEHLAKFTYTGDPARLESGLGIVSAGFEEGTPGWKYTASPINMTVWNPDDAGQQHMLCDVTYDRWTVYANFGGNPPPDTDIPPGSYTVEVNTHQHDETFTSNYNIELYKYDYETGKPLQNSTFEILEKMDTSQFDDSVDHNGGNAAGILPLDDLEFNKFSKTKVSTDKPTDDWQLCSEETTDEKGKIEHRDVFKYDFSAIYCDGQIKKRFLRPLLFL